uniref:Vacuolar protein sorting-associated protein 26C n=1 Tax=Anopheles epiroticus TaxID=199890 RepID=A0A182PHB0_9DIPT
MYKLVRCTTRLPALNRANVHRGPTNDVPPPLGPTPDLDPEIRRQIEEDKKRLQWRTPYSERPDSFYSAFKLFASENRNSELVEKMQQPINLSPSAILEWWMKRRNTIEAHMQKFIPERHATLGDDIATAHFIVHRGGSVRFRGSDKWIQKDEDDEYDLPRHHIPGLVLEEVRCDGMTLFYEGMENIQKLLRLKHLSFEKVVQFDDWHLDRISGNVLPSLEKLNLRGTAISHRGLNCLYRLPSLKLLLVDDPEKDIHWKLTVAMLEEWNPNLRETVSGVVQIVCGSETKHDGITLALEGSVNLQISNKNVGIFEALYNSVKPITLLNQHTDLAPSGKLPIGASEFPFEFPLICPKEPKTLYETYHGVFVNITYMLRCDIKRSFLAKSVQKTQQFIIQYRPAVEHPPKEVQFSISPETLQKTAKERISIPRFRISGTLDSTDCCVTKPFTGSVTVHHTEVAIKSIEIQLVRVETCGCAEGYSRDATEIQNIQIADGNVCPKVAIPIYMTLPRLFTCPTLITKNFKVEFEVNLVIIFGDDYLVTENFQILLNRTA